MASSAPDRTEGGLALGRTETVTARGPIGIVGCGGVTRATIGSLLAAGGRVAWVVDPDTVAREALVRELAAQQDAPRAYGEIATALQHDDGSPPVMINSPGALHLAHVEAVASSRRPMLVAKPLALDWDQTQRALALAEAAGVAIEVAEQYPDESHAQQLGALIHGHGPARRISFDHRKPGSAQSTLVGREQTGVLEYAVHHYALFASWLDELPRAMAVDTWTSDDGRSGQGSIGHSWIRYESCHVLHAFGFGGERAVYRAEIDLDGLSVAASGTHFCASDVEVKTSSDTESTALPKSPGVDAWRALFARWLMSDATSTAPQRRRHIQIVAAMTDAALIAARTGAVVDLASEPRYEHARDR